MKLRTYFMHWGNRDVIFKRAVRQYARVVGLTLGSHRTSSTTSTASDSVTCKTEFSEPDQNASSTPCTIYTGILQMVIACPFGFVESVISVLIYRNKHRHRIDGNIIHTVWGSSPSNSLELLTSMSPYSPIHHTVTWARLSCSQDQNENSVQLWRYEHT